MDCPRCGHPSTDHPRNAKGERYCSVGLNELPSCKVCRDHMEAISTTVMIDTLVFDSPLRLAPGDTMTWTVINTVADCR